MILLTNVSTLTTAILFGMESPSVAKREARMLQSRNVVQTTEYIRLKYDLLIKQNAFDRGEKLTSLEIDTRSPNAWTKTC